jgi:hypothetical protein
MKKTYEKPTLVRRDTLVKLAASMTVPSDFDDSIS